MVELPLDVYNAFQTLKSQWRKLLKEDELSLIFLNVVHIARTGDLLILKQFALSHPKEYINALANGYTISEKDRKIDAIRRWYQGALNREQDKVDPDGFAKEAIEEVVHYLGAEEIIADLSPFCRHQMQRRAAKQNG